MVREKRTEQAIRMNQIKSASLTGALLLALPGASLLAVELAPETVVTANRAVTPKEQVGSSVTVIDAAELREQGITTLEDALRRSPGVFSESIGGQRGSISSLFLRGTGTAQSHLQVDGIRLSDSSVSSGNFLGNSLLDGVGTIEVLRGPQSALYGGESIGGVVSIRTARGVGDPVTRLGVEGGSFGSMRAAVSSSGEVGKLSYTLHGGWEQTDNDAPSGVRDLFHRQTSYALRLDYQASDVLTIGMSFRGGDAQYRDSFGGLNLTEYALGTIYAELLVNPDWTSRLRVGVYEEDYDFGDPSTFGTEAEKWSLVWENELHSGDDHLTSFGALFERTDYAQDFSFPGEGDQYGVYVNHAWEVVDGLTLTGGGRWEDYDSYGDEFTWRGAVAYQVPNSGTTIRASYGTAFRTPSLLELNGGPFEAGNPDLRPERSEGWDLGIEQEIGDQLVVNVTWFENEIENQIVDPFGAPGSNLSGKGNANGLEFGLAGEGCDGAIRYGLAYTYLQRSLNDLPDHVVDGWVRWEATERLVVGAGVSYVGERTLGGDPLDDYLLVRVFGNYEVTENLSLSLRVENLADEEYSYISFGGTPETGRGRGVFAGAVVTF